ncbi:hypothetical protein SAMN05443377_11335 [Propionibacterium cyclohexanicum]|uniref:DUF1989 domain-containing protein n=1 Tax=Propionibacterium cyclohexanicum TaxID=64702 RepID=A0A1H9SIL0_9ACTN|nr:hypothetical protein SAMN05443377_11335 [Propionibacterium cyclohexanicum]
MVAIADQHKTGTLLDARQDARARESESSEYMPYLPAHKAPEIPEGVEPDLMVWAETVAPGGYTHKRVARGTRIRFTDAKGDACAHVLIYNAIEPIERLNVADTVKIPWQAYLVDGHPLLSGEGRVLATVCNDSSGHHDALCGTSTRAWNESKYAASASHGAAPAGAALFELGAAKHGLGVRDLPPSISFFKGVRVASDGDLQFTGGAGPGCHVEIVAEMPLIVLVANVPHPLDPRSDYIVGPLRVDAWRGHPTGPADSQFTAAPEAHRAYLNTLDYLAAQGIA